jgi:hypothetical protein
MGATPIVAETVIGWRHCGTGMAADGIVNLGGRSHFGSQRSALLRSPQAAVAVRQAAKDRDRKNRSFAGLSRRV